MKVADGSQLGKAVLRGGTYHGRNKAHECQSLGSAQYHPGTNQGQHLPLTAIRTAKTTSKLGGVGCVLLKVVTRSIADN